jgi:tetratricopeptide (TPR) repeat protein
MQAHRSILSIGLIFLAGTSLLGAAALERADTLFANGFFPEAESAYTKALDKNRNDLRATTLLGMIDLFSNRLDESEKYLRRAAQAGPFETVAQNLLGELYYRRDQFPEAARWLRAGGSADRAELIEQFGEMAPYTITGLPNETRLPFVVTDPLPIVRVRVNGSEMAQFLIDTGGAEVQLDTELAQRLNLNATNGISTMLLDGSQAEMRHASVASLQLGDFEVQNVPVGVRRLPVFGGRQLDGVIGTVLLYHFLATLDYPNGELILRRRSAEALHAFETRALAEKQIAMPFWLASDHLIVARGRVNRAPQALLLVSTGFASGFACPESTIEQASLSFDRQGSIVPANARPTNLAPFIVGDLYLGEARQQNIAGVAGAFPAGLEHGFGFRISGLIAHQFFRQYAVTFDFTGMRLYLRSSLLQPPRTTQTEAQTALLPY